MTDPYEDPASRMSVHRGMKMAEVDRLKDPHMD